MRKPNPLKRSQNKLNRLVWDTFAPLLLGLLMYYLTVMSFDIKSYEFAAIFFVFGTWAIGSVIEKLFSIQFPGWIIPTLAFLSATVASILNLLGYGDLDALELWRFTIPKNGQILSENEVPLNTFTFYLEEEYSPVYIKIDPSSHSPEDVEFHMYGPDGSVIFSPRRYRIECANKYGCVPAMFKFCYNQSGEYKIKARAFRAFNQPIDIVVLKSRWIELFHYVRESTCPTIPSPPAENPFGSIIVLLLVIMYSVYALFVLTSRRAGTYFQRKIRIPEQKMFT